MRIAGTSKSLSLPMPSVLGALLLATSTGCSAGPAAQQDPRGAEAGKGTPSAATADDWAQFDNGSYNMNRRDSVVGTFFVNNQSVHYTELWVLSTTAGKVSCSDTSCDIAGVTLKKRNQPEACSAWKNFAGGLADRKVLVAKYTAEDLKCGVGCEYSNPNPAHSFSLFPAGGYTQVGANLPRVFVDTAGGKAREYWIMASFIGAEDATFASVNAGSLSEFACGGCRFGATKVYKVQYDPRTSIDCSDLDLPN